MTESRRIRLTQQELEDVLGTAYGKDDWQVSEVILRHDGGIGDVEVVEYPEGCDVVFIPRVQIPPDPPQQEGIMAYPLPTATPFVSQTSVSVVEDDDVPF